MRQEKRSKIREKKEAEAQQKSIESMTTDKIKELKLHVANQEKIINELKLENEQLNSDAQNSLTKQTVNTRKTKKRKCDSLNSGFKSTKVAKDETPITIDEIKEVLMNSNHDVGGLTRMTAFSEVHHEQNPKSSILLFGMRSWKEVKVHLHDLFSVKVVPQKFKVTRKRNRHGNVETRLKRSQLAKHEQALIALIFLKSVTHQTKLATTFNVERQPMSRHIACWLPKWAKMGKFLSILPMFEDCCEKDLPDI